MTCREKLKLEHPGDLDSSYLGGCWGCPMDYDYHSKAIDDCPIKKGGCDVDKSTVPEDICTRCWDREVDEISEQDVMDVIVNQVEDERKRRSSSIKDSGDRTQFSTGAVRDMREGKGRCDLMCLDVVARILNNNALVPIHSFQESGQVDYLYDVLRFHSIFEDPYTMFLEVAKHFEEGAKKYGESNWQKGIPANCYIDSAVRHYLKFLRGDTDERHDRAFVWNILCCIWTVENKPELNTYKNISEVH